jgi:hypothetical protein
MRALPPPHRASIDTEALGHDMNGSVSLEEFDRAESPPLELSRAPCGRMSYLPQWSIAS